MIKILFVCHGNICRSPMCEFVFKDMVEREGLAGQFYIESRATHTDEIWGDVGNPVYPPAKKKLAEHGLSCEGKRAQLLEYSEYGKYDYFIGMDGENLHAMKRILRGDPDGKVSLLLDYTDRPRSVADPWYTRDFETTYRDVVEGCTALLAYMRQTYGL